MPQNPARFNPVISRAEIRAALARAYCSKDNRHKELDVVLIEEMANEVMEAINAAIERSA